jgi:hypothetical protein
VLNALEPSSTPQDGIAALPPDLGKASDDINEQIRQEMGHPGEPAAPGRLAAPEAAPSPKPSPKPEAGAIASLAARPVSPGAALASPASALTGEPERRLRLGEPPQAEPGRADDFTR